MPIRADQVDCILVIGSVRTVSLDENETIGVQVNLVGMCSKVIPLLHVEISARNDWLPALAEGVDGRRDLGGPVRVGYTYGIPADQALAIGTGFIKKIIADKELAGVSTLFCPVVDGHQVGAKRFRQSRLVGEHNLENILCAAGVGAALDIANADLKSGIESVSAIPGRLEFIENKIGRFVYVDYAHTPDALENVIMALKAVMQAKMICVFGCGGDRDKEKRPLMGEIAARLCDLAVITSDNPRTEDPMVIIDHIIAGAQKASGRRYQTADLSNGYKEKGYVVEADRKQAIRLGIAVSKPGDTVLIAGKGHETYQLIGSTTIDFDDRDEARKALRAIRLEP